MPPAADGDKVRVHYEGRTKEHGVFDSSEGRDPLEFEVGAEQVIPGFEEAVRGLDEGDSTTVTLPPGDAYGERREDLVAEVPKEQLGEGFDPDVGQALELSTPDGQTFQATVVGKDDDTITLDQNHPLAGQELTFEIELVEIV